MTFRSVTAAESLMRGVSRGSWDLADALVADVPERSQGRKSGDAHPDFLSVRDAIVAIVGAMDERGITTPNGDSYNVEGLMKARATAIAWPESQRHSEAAYRTHQEIGSPQRRVVLNALCQYANGEKVPNPDPSWIDDDAFDSACQMVEMQVSKGKGYPVSANAVRVAMQRKPNVAKPPSTTFEMVAAMHKSAGEIRNFIQLTKDNGVGLTDDERDSFREGINTMIAMLKDLVDLVGGISDADLMQLLEREER